MDFKRFPNPDDLLILLTVARLGRFTAVADALEITHTTVSRRILALDKQLGGRTLERTPQGWELTELGRAAVSAAEGIEQNLTLLSSGLGQGKDIVSGVVRVSTSDGFGALIATPALVRLQLDHPLLRVELLSATRKLSRNRSGVDLEVVAGSVDAGRAEVIFLTDYTLRLYAGRGYVEAHGLPGSEAGLKDHRFISYVESTLQVAELAQRHHRSTSAPAEFQSTSVFAQIEAVRANAGIGMLPAFMADGQEGFVRVLPGEVEQRVQYWAAARPESLRSPAVQAVVAALLRETRRQQHRLLPA
ncbi:DNA-binding transcriptional LysR family regulator [Arthrobacter silviterrae]|uniref:LysR family transcriptional regulator n=1 Tax=Arthrobacter silviterrae TaxID=2026658 RepID=A0ABX0DE82_9MICC|nr:MULTISPECIES: LysR family transcriptional regulator [Arthrobacter]MCU6480253.1 LysR family transcriptional regulator [Arthrobacter sp. A2-55]MDQ0278933.1 DNA-binding transcriptional LysR family regulator [Arthrobacter silviterrae]NGN84036.1 LysR family transcriptional regulator [Arthrobacter silviterrae]